MASPIDIIAARLRAAIGQGLGDATGELNNAAAGAKTDVAGPLNAVFGGGGGLVGSVLALIPGVGLGVSEAATLVLEKLGGAAKFVEGVAAGWALGEFFSEAAKPLWLEITHAINAQFVTLLLDPGTLAELVAKGIYDHPHAASDAAGNNLAGDHFSRLVEAAQERPDAGSLLDMLNRNEIQNQDALDALQHHGYPPEWAARIIGLRRQLLSPADLALADLRGNVPAGFADTYGALLGMTPEDMLVLKENTGEPPGPQELMEAVRRGFIPDERFQHGIRQSRIRNEWMDVLEKLRFHPMSIADAVRGVVEHHLTFDEGLTIAMQNGLEESHFKVLVDSWGRPLSHEQMMTLYHRGKATRAEVDQALAESDIKNEYATKAFELGRRLIPERTIVSMANHGVLPHDEGVRMLQELGFDAANADLLMKLGASQRKNTNKILSRADVVAMYTDHLTKRAEAHAQLVKLGYTAEDSTDILELADYKIKAGALKTVQHGIQASFKAGHLTADAAKSALIDAGMDSAQAQRLIDTWAMQREHPTKTLSQAQILKLAEKKLIDQQDAFDRLLGEGLVSADAILLLRLHGIIDLHLPAA